MVTSQESGPLEQLIFSRTDSIYRLERESVSREIHNNPKVEICALKNGEWLRVSGELIEDDRLEAKVSMLDAYPNLKSMYKADDGKTEVFCFKNATATFYSFTKEPRSVEC